MKRLVINQFEHFWGESWNSARSRGAWTPSEKFLFIWRASIEVNFFMQIYNNKLIININEAGFGRSVKENYSWLQKGKSCAIVNDVFHGRANLILGVSQTGDFFEMITNKTVKTENYWLYLIVLTKALKYSKINIKNEVILLQD